MSRCPSTDPREPYGRCQRTEKHTAPCDFERPSTSVPGDFAVHEQFFSRRPS